MADEQIKLRPKQAAFVEAYLGEAKGNGKQAAQIAGYNATDNSLYEIASQNLRKLNIQKALEIESAKLAEQYKKRREGLLNDIDEVKQEIIETKAEFPDNPGVRVQLIARRLEAIDKEAKLTGAYTAPKENPVNEADRIDRIARRMIELDSSIDEPTALEMARSVQDIGRVG